MKNKLFPLLAALLLTTALSAPAARAGSTSDPDPSSFFRGRAYDRPEDLERFKTYYLARNNMAAVFKDIHAQIILTTASLPRLYTLVQVRIKSDLGDDGGERYVINSIGEIEPWSMKAVSGAIRGNYPTDEDKDRLIKQMIDWNERGFAWKKIGSVKDIPDYEGPSTVTQLSPGPGPRDIIHRFLPQSPQSRMGYPYYSLARPYGKLYKDFEALIRPQWKVSGLPEPGLSKWQTVTCYTYTRGSGIVRRYQFIFSDKDDFINATDLQLGFGIGPITVLN